ncbi:Uncharacterised protein [uncultured archaeon]|nr:Uncharacterised protein [uncultured archaeon]
MVNIMKLRVDEALGPSTLRWLERQGAIRRQNWLDDNQGAVANRLRAALPGLPEPFVEWLGSMVTNGGGTKAGDNPHNALGAVEHVLRQLNDAKVDAVNVQPLAQSDDIRQLRKRANELLLRAAAEKNVAQDPDA